MVGTPAVRPELVARLARAYYHADPQLIDETSVRGEDGIWRDRDPRRPRQVANALVRAELPGAHASESPAALRRARGRELVRGRDRLPRGRGGVLRAVWRNRPRTRRNGCWRCCASSVFAFVAFVEVKRAGRDACAGIGTASIARPLAHPSSLRANPLPSFL